MKIYTMKKFNTTILKGAGLTASIALLSTSANATVLAFDGLGTNATIPDTFGDNISAAETGVLVTNGTTPNIGLTWDGNWEFYNDGEWSGAQLQAYGTGTNHDIIFTPDSGFAVLVDSFVFDDYAAFAGGNEFDWSLTEDTATGNLIGSGTGTTTDGQDLTVNTGMTSAYEGIVVLRITESAGSTNASNADQAIDTVSFTQVAVPEPSSTALLGLGGLALFLRRRRN